ncbi:hypothetical protein [Telmatospirillum sp.]|uniref:hypothetical protein n=1 Tax=Telmatospirillum sp. TaxID=2079197 RepID=UPI0028505475|nr:hypothetical protein [Telmatospirillum sp.]MDR3441057.1 hypothetical protein [Telmatospirillum sp.]
MTPAAQLPSLSRSAVVFLAALWLVKVGLLLLLGPVVFPDTGLYLHLGGEILNNPAWWRDGGWGDGFAPPALLRPYGYPLLVAGARLLAGSSYDHVLGLLQISASVALLALFVRVAWSLIADRRLLAVLTLLAALSGFSLFDGALLTDSLYSVLFLAVLLTLVAQMLGRATPGWAISLVLGVAWALSLSLRDVGLFHTIFPLVGVVLAARRHGLGLGRTVSLAFCFVLPVVLFVAVVIVWNGYRTGHPFYSITGGVNWLWPSVNMADRGLANPFDCADQVCDAARAHGVGKGMDGVLGLAQALWSDDHLDPVALGRVTLHHFLQTTGAHPVAFVVSVLGNMQLAHLADLAFNPLVNINEFCRLNAAIGTRLVPGLRELLQAVRHGELQVLPALLGSVVLALASLAGLVAFVIGTPIVAWRHRFDRESRVIIFLWAVAILFVGSYSIVHMEMRHAMPVIPLILLVTGWTLGRVNKLSNRP